jgi:hypothetical protein
MGEDGKVNIISQIQGLMA